MKPFANAKFSLLILLVSAIAVAFTLWLRLGNSATTPAAPLRSREALGSLPGTMLWAWERPEDLQFIDTQKLGVAYLAKTIRLGDGSIDVRPRVQPLHVPPETKVVGVARIETDQRQSATQLTATQLQEAAKEIVELGTLQSIAAIQVDFDARTSERGFYRQLLLKIRQELPSSMPLSMTALASWCVGDNWVSELPVDEVVPMFFRLGVERNQFISHLQSNTSLSQPCNHAAGVSIDEVIALPHQERLYIFSPKPWTLSTVKTALETYRR